MHWRKIKQFFCRHKWTTRKQSSPVSELTICRDKLMTLDVMEGSGKYRIGVLSTKWLDLDAVEDEELASIINH